MPLPSEFDNIHTPIARDFINKERKFFIENFFKKNDSILDIGNQGKEIPELHEFNIQTLDITPDTSPDVIADITLYNDHIPANSYDVIMCTEVLEHVVDPFAAIREIRRIAKVGGHIFFTTPLNARIHGPIPDCWRFTEFGLKVLFRDFEIIRFEKLETPGRNLFPLHYACIAKKKDSTGSESDPRKMQFQRIK